MKTTVMVLPGIKIAQSLQEVRVQSWADVFEKAIRDHGEVTFQDVVHGLGLQVPDAGRVKGAEELVRDEQFVRVGAGRWLLYPLNYVTVDMNIPPSPLCKRRCSCLDFQIHQEPKREACKHIVAMAMLLAKGIAKN